MSRKQTTIIRAEDDQASGTFHATVTTRDGRLIETDDDWDGLTFWLWHCRRGANVAKVEIREWTIDELNSGSVGPIYNSPGF